MLVKAIMRTRYAEFCGIEPVMHVVSTSPIPAQFQHTIQFKASIELYPMV